MIEDNIRKGMCIYMYDWVTFLRNRNWYNVVNQLSFNKKFFLRIKNERQVIKSLSLSLFFVFLVFVRATSVAYGGSQARGTDQSYCCWPTPQPQPGETRVLSATYTTAHGNVRSLTH